MQATMPRISLVLVVVYECFQLQALVEAVSFGGDHEKVERRETYPYP